MASPFSRAISSMSGAISLQGPHHSAQKSTRTGFSLLFTSRSKFDSVTGGGGGGGSTVRGAGTSPTGGVGNGLGATGGLGIGTVPGLDTKGGTAVGVGSEVGGRDGRLIRTVSCSSGAAASPWPGGRVIRSVRFLGSLASAMVIFTCETQRLSKISRFVTPQLTLGQ